MEMRLEGVKTESFDICAISFGLRAHDVQVLQDYTSDGTVQLSTFSRLMKQSIGAPEYFSNSLLARANMLGGVTGKKSRKL